MFSNNNNKMDLSNITFRFLEKEEFSRSDLVEVFTANNKIAPQPESAKIAIAEYEGNIIGFYTIQIAYHAEPIWVHKNFQHLPIYKKLATMTIDSVKNIKGLCLYVFATNEKIVRLAERFGFKKLSYIVMEQEF